MKKAAGALRKCQRFGCNKTIRDDAPPDQKYCCCSCAAIATSRQRNKTRMERGTNVGRKKKAAKPAISVRVPDGLQDCLSPV